MRRQLSICAVVIFSFTSAFAQVSQEDWLEYLIVPSPECGVQWYAESSFFDYLRANPTRSLAGLEQEKLLAVAANDFLSQWRIDIDRALVYSHIDSVATSQRLASVARDNLQAIYATHKTAAIAYQIGRALDCLGKEKEAVTWYEQACQIDPEYYPAHLALLDNRAWTERATRLVERIVTGKRDQNERARVAFEYAERLSDMIAKYGIEDFFSFFSEAMKTEADSLALEKQAFSQMMNVISAYCQADVLHYLNLACALDPDNTAYALRYGGGELARLFFGGIEKMNAEEERAGGVSQDLVMEQVLVELRPEVEKVKFRLAAIPLAEKELFPAAYYYLAFADYVLGDYEGALINIKRFIRLSPENKYAYVFHCGIVTTLSNSGGPIPPNLSDDTVILNKSKCATYPTAWDCYRLGCFWYLMGYTRDSETAFTNAALYDGKDLRPRLALAVCALKLGDERKAVSLIENIEPADLVGQQKVCLFILQGVLAAQASDYDVAKYWAQKARDEDKNSETLETELFLQALNNH